MSFSSHNILYVCFHVQDYRKTIKLHDIRFGKAVKFLELIFPENDHCGNELKKKISAEYCGWRKRLLQKYVIKKILGKTSGKDFKCSVSL